MCRADGHGSPSETILCCPHTKKGKKGFPRRTVPRSLLVRHLLAPYTQIFVEAWKRLIVQTPQARLSRHWSYPWNLWFWCVLRWLTESEHGSQYPLASTIESLICSEDKFEAIYTSLMVAESSVYCRARTLDSDVSGDRRRYTKVTENPRHNKFHSHNCNLLTMGIGHEKKKSQIFKCPLRFLKL